MMYLCVFFYAYFCMVFWIYELVSSISLENTWPECFHIMLLPHSHSSYFLEPYNTYLRHLRCLLCLFPLYPFFPSDPSSSSLIFWSIVSNILLNINLFFILVFLFSQFCYFHCNPFLMDALSLVTFSIFPLISWKHQLSLF